MDRLEIEKYRLLNMIADKWFDGNFGLAKNFYEKSGIAEEFEGEFYKNPHQEDLAKNFYDKYINLEDRL